MADLVVLYKTPQDPKAFDTYYFENHIPLARKIPSLRKYTVTKGPIATLSFDNMAAIGAAFASAEGMATASDVPKFASGGVEMHFAETAEV